MLPRSEALPYVLPVALGAAATASTGYELAALAFALLATALAAFFLDPERESADPPNCILSPGGPSAPRRCMSPGRPLLASS